MRKLVFLVFFIGLISSCTDDSMQSMTVSGNVKGLKKGKLYLQKVQDSSLVVIDSIEIKGDGVFNFKTELASPEVFYLYLNKKDNNEFNDRITFFGEPGAITINTDWNAFDTNAKISGSKTHEKWEEYRKNMSKFNARNLELVQLLQRPEIQQDSIALDSVARLNDKNTLRSYLYALNYAVNNKDSYVAPYIALYDVSDANIKYLDSIYKVLTPEVVDSKYGRELQRFLTKESGQ